MRMGIEIYFKTDRAAEVLKKSIEYSFTDFINRYSCDDVISGINIDIPDLEEYAVAREEADKNLGENEYPEWINAYVVITFDYNKDNNRVISFFRPWFEQDIFVKLNSVAMEIHENWEN